MIDPVNGGLRGAPKFPQCTMLENLWRAGLHRGEERFFGLVERSLERMCRGGIYDHLGGGFSRLLVDEHWLVSAFKKMLYLELLALAHRRSGNPLFRTQQDPSDGSGAMVTAEGAFAASLNTDSSAEEGKFYVWSLAEELRQSCGPNDAPHSYSELRRNRTRKFRRP